MGWRSRSFSQESTNAPWPAPGPSGNSVIEKHLLNLQGRFQEFSLYFRACEPEDKRPRTRDKGAQVYVLMLVKFTPRPVQIPALPPVSCVTLGKSLKSFCASVSSSAK